MNRTLRATSLALSILMVVGCAGESLDSTTGGTARVGIKKEPRTFVDWNARSNVDLMAADLIFRSLARPGAEPGSFMPDLARGWTIDETARTIDFELRDDVAWDDGAPVTADDVVFSERRAAEPGAMFANYKTTISSVEATGPHGVRFTFSTADPQMLAHAVVGHVYPKHILEQVSSDELATHSFNRRPVGSGPFRLESWEPGQFLAFAARDETIRLETLVLRVLADDDAVLRELEGGGIDLSRVRTEAVERLAGNPDIAVHVAPTRSYFHLVWNTRRAPLDRALVRRSLAALLDRDAIATRFAGSAERRADGPVTPDHPWFAPVDPGLLPGPGDTERPARSIELLTLAGNKAYGGIAAVVAQSWRRAGVDVELVEVELAQYVGRMRSGDFDVILRSRSKRDGVDLADAFGENGGSNYGGFRDDALEHDLAAFASATELRAARAAFDRAVERIATLEPWTFLFFQNEHNAAHRRLRGVERNVRDPVAAAAGWWVEP